MHTTYHDVGFIFKLQRTSKLFIQVFHMVYYYFQLSNKEVALVIYVYQSHSHNKCI